MVNASMDTCGRLYLVSFREDEHLLYFKVFILLLVLFISWTNTCVPPGLLIE